jgi:penicillin amidase
MRMVVSLANLDDSTWVNLTGASGHAFAGHYTDQTDLWAEGRAPRWPFTRAAVERAGQDTLRLEPGGSG